MASGDIIISEQDVKWYRDKIAPLYPVDDTPTTAKEYQKAILAYAHNCEEFLKNLLN